MLLLGAPNSQLHLGWFEEARLLVMAYKVCYQQYLSDSSTQYIESASETRCVLVPKVYGPTRQLTQGGTALLAHFARVQNPHCDEGSDEAAPGRHPFMPQADTVTPQWLKAVAPEARVNSNVLKIFDSFKDGDQCFAQVMQSVTGKRHRKMPLV